MEQSKRKQSLSELFESANRDRTNTTSIKEESEDMILRTKLELATKMHEMAQNKIEELQEQLRDATAELDLYNDGPDNGSGSKMKSLAESRRKYFVAVTEAREKETCAREEFLAALRR